MDGWANSDNAAQANGGGPLVGDFDAVNPGAGYRQLYSFDLSTIPGGATLVTVNLRLYQAGVSGDPYGELGDVIVDHVAYGSALDGSDYAGGTLSASIGTLSTTSDVEYKNLDVTDELVADLAAGRPRSQFRIRFSPADGNDYGNSDLALFTDQELSCCVGVTQQPKLVVTYDP